MPLEETEPPNSRKKYDGRKSKNATAISQVEVDVQEGRKLTIKSSRSPKPSCKMIALSFNLIP
jgi:hypothetical protein